MIASCILLTILQLEQIIIMSLLISTYGVYGVNYPHKNPPFPLLWLSPYDDFNSTIFLLLQVP